MHGGVLLNYTWIGNNADFYFPVFRVCPVILQPDHQESWTIFDGSSGQPAEAVSVSQDLLTSCSCFPTSEFFSGYNNNFRQIQLLDTVTHLFYHQHI